jgi:hypothetical protein
MGKKSLDDAGYTLIGKMLFSIPGGPVIETLEAISKDEHEADNAALLEEENVIEEWEGVHYINEEILNSGSGVALNRDFKDLVDLVIK